MVTYNILEANVKYKESVIVEINVLVQISEHDVRAIQSSNFGGWDNFIIPFEATLNEDLLQEVAGYGMQVHNINSVFPNYKQ